MINNFTAIIVATNETVDQNSNSIRVVRIVLTQIAIILQNGSVAVEVVQQVSPSVHDAVYM